MTITRAFSRRGRFAESSLRHVDFVVRFKVGGSPLLQQRELDVSPAKKRHKLIGLQPWAVLEVNLPVIPTEAEGSLFSFLQFLRAA